MNEEKLIALIEVIIDEQIQAIPTTQGKRGLKGPKGNPGNDGKDGKSFSWDEYREKIIEQIKAHSVQGEKGERGDRGPRGQRGTQGIPGNDGQDGKSFIWEENLEKIESLVEKHKFKFADFTDKEKESLKGAQGPRGLRGLRGPKGEKGDKGESGKDFSWDEFKEPIEKLIKANAIQGEKGDRGARGQRGKPGINGLSAYDLWEKENKGDLKDFFNALKGKDGIPGLSGLNGEDGKDGKDGEDGKDAPEIVDVKVIVLKDKFYFKFYFSDQSVIETNKVDIPSGDKKTSIINEATLVRALLTTFDEGVELTKQTKSYNFTGDLVNAVDDGDGNVQVNISNAEAGIVLQDITCDTSVYIGAAVYIDTMNIAQNALADDILTSNVLGFVESKSSSVLCDVRVSGRTKDNFSGLDVTKDYYLSDVVPGAIQTNVPVTSGHVKIRLGQPATQERFVYLKGEPIIRA